MTEIPESHPRHASLRQRHLIEEGVKKGITHAQGLIAQGRGEAFDYLLGERTTKPAEKAALAAATALINAANPVISVNGNTAVLCPEEIAGLADAANAKIEVNLFYRNREREERIAAVFRELAAGREILGVNPDSGIKGLDSERGKVSSAGIGKADVVLVALEDGDRTEVLKKAGKKVIAIDLNPLSRTAQKADITVVDNVVRAVPLITRFAGEAGGNPKKEFDNRKNLEDCVRLIREGLC